MKKLKSVLVFALVAFLLLGTISVFIVPAKANTTPNATTSDEARYTQKIVSVLMDDSGSMRNEKRNDYALYSIQMLMSMLGENDSLTLSAMNNSREEKVDLSAPDRNAELRRVMNNSFLKNPPNGGTPGSAIKKAVNILTKAGLQTRDQLSQTQTNTEYWLVILTDGAFDGSSGDAGVIANEIAGYIDDYPTMQTVYLGFGGAVDLSGTSLTTTYPFHHFLASSTDGIIDAMQGVANLMSGRFTLPSDAYKINGSTVTVDLDSYEYALASISVIAQNCGAQIKQATYLSNPIAVSTPCIIEPTAALEIMNGYSAVIKGDPYMSGGKLTLEFDAPINQIAIMAEPALFITPYIEYYDGSAYQRADIQYVNANLKAGDNIRIGYEVFEKSNGKPVDVQKLFGKAETKVTYAGNSYVCGEDFPLVLGTNDISVKVSVMDGKYTMYDNITCIVEADPSHYRIEADFDEVIGDSNLKTRAVYTVYVNNKPITADELKNYTVEVVLTSPDGQEIKTDVIKGSDGKIQTSAPISEGAYGVYTETITVTSDKGVSREHTHDSKYYPANVTVTLVSGGGFSINESQLAKGQAQAVSFELTVDGKPIDFANEMFAFELLFDGANVSSYASVSGNSLSYTPNSNDTGKGVLDVGEKEVSLKVYLKDLPSISGSAVAKFTLTPSAYVVEVVETDNRSLNRFKLEENTAELRFRILRDGEPLNFTEIKSLYDKGSITVTNDGKLDSYFLPLDYSFNVRDFGEFGIVSVTVQRDTIPFYRWHAEMFVGGGDETVVVSFRDSSASDFFSFESTLWTYVIRIFHVWLFWHFVHWLIGCFIARPITSCVAVSVSLDIPNDGIVPDTEDINVKKIEKLIFHGKRFFKFGPYLFMHEKEKMLSFGTLRCKRRLGSFDNSNISVMFDGIDIHECEPQTLPDAFDQYCAQLSVNEFKYSDEVNKGELEEKIKQRVLRASYTVGEAIATDGVSDSSGSLGGVYGVYGDADGGRGKQLQKVMFFIIRSR